jgi:sec-independent protein translocase protein TatB
MFDFSWTEILLIAAVALVVIGPKDLPRVLKTAGQWAGRARAVAREFQFQIDQMIRESELDDVRKTVNAAVSADPNKTIRDMVDPTGEIEKSVSGPEMMGQAQPPAGAVTAQNEPLLPGATPTLPAPAPSTLHAAPEPEPEPVPAVSDEAKSGTHG